MSYAQCVHCYALRVTSQTAIVLALGEGCPKGHAHGERSVYFALLRTLNAASIAGIRAVLLHAISDDAKRFYEKAGFSTSPVDPMTMMIALSDVEKALDGR